MSDKPKRKRSEKAKPRLRLYSLMGLYALFLIPYLFNLRFFLYLLIALTVGLSILAIGSYFMKMVRRLKKNLLIDWVMSAIAIATTTLVWLLLTQSTWVGLFLWNDFLDDFMIHIYYIPDLKLLSAGICFLFAVELHTQTSEFMNPVSNYAMQTEKQKNNNRSSLSDDLEEPDIPFELLAEVESAEQKMK